MDISRLKHDIDELAKLVNPELSGISQFERVRRLIRDKSSNSATHAKAAKAALKSLIANGNNVDDLATINRFEVNCEALRKIDPKLLDQFLLLFRPLAFTINTSTTKPKQLTSMSLSKNNTVIKDAPIMPLAKIENKPTHDFDIDEIENKIIDNSKIWMTKEVEYLILVDLVFVFQGVSGKYIKFDNRTESYIIDPLLHMNITAKDTILCLCELGWLYNRVKDYVNKIFATNCDSKGLITQAFGFSLQEELHDYFRLLTVLKQELDRTKSHLNSNKSHDGPNTAPTTQYHHSSGLSTLSVRNNETEEGTVGLTLLRLKAWMQEPIDRMCLLARLVDSTSALTGGALLSRLHSHSKHGDVNTSTIVYRILDSVCIPVYNMLTRWVLHGELNDVHSEFFIASNNSNNSGNSSTIAHNIAASMTSNMLTALSNNTVKNVWRDTYYLRESMLPSFLSHNIATKILVIGKSINFIKLCVQKFPKKTAAETLVSKQQKKLSFREYNKSKHLSTYGRIVDNKDDNSNINNSSNKNKHTLRGRTIITDTTSNNNKDNDHNGDDNNSLMNIDAQSVVSDDTIRSNATNTPTSATTLKIPNIFKESAFDHDVILEATSSKEVLADITTNEVELALQSLRYGGELKLTELIYNISSLVDTRLLYIIHSRFYVQEHFLALKKFMLLGQGDFVTCLMDSVGPELKKRANLLFRHNLTGILEGALRSSNAQYEPSYVLDRVGIRLLEASPGDSGWEIFSLDYTIDIPLNAIVHQDAVAKYRIAFHMLWRLKRVEWSLSTAWKQLTSYIHTSRDMPLVSLRNVFHRCTLYRARMLHVVNNLCAFLMFEVMETAWVTLQDNISRATCLDDVIIAHDNYLNEILDKSLLAPQHETLNMHLQQLLQSILRFCNLEETLVADALASIARKRVVRNVNEDRERRGQWGMDEEELDGLYGGAHGGDGSSVGGEEMFYDGIPGYVIERLEDANRVYNQQFDILMNLMKEQSEKAGDILRYLTFRLDFNNYHSKQQQQQQRDHEEYTRRATTASNNTNNNDDDYKDEEDYNNSDNYISPKYQLDGSNHLTGTNTAGATTKKLSLPSYSNEPINIPVSTRSNTSNVSSNSNSGLNSSSNKRK